MTVLSIPGVLAQQAEQRPDAIAILGLEGEPLTYGRLYEQVQKTVETLHTFGVGRRRRVGLVASQGPVMATALFSVTSCATVVPLNPALHTDEYRSYLQWAGVEHLILQSGAQPDARAAARDCAIPIIELTVSDGPVCGLFTLSGEAAPPAADTGLAQPEDVSMVMLSSGTTSRPKIIPREQADLVNAALVGNRVLNFTPQDRLLNIFSLWYTGGQAGVTRMIIAGGSTVCMPGFDAPRFFEWLDRFEPTLFTATASMFRAILAHAAANAAILQRHKLRYLRTGSMVMPADLVDELERVFRVPVIQNYGSTEVGSITISPLPPKVRKRDSVGPAIGGEVAIFDADNRQLAPGQVGEIRVHGLPMFKGYENDPALNAAAFADGWFRTGDQGYLDEDGYLFITGRLKEVISRGGEKISPQELEAVLMTCPDVAEVAVFGVPDPHLGEEIGTAIVLKPGSSASARDIRLFASTHLAASKIPRHIVFLEALPKTPFGKLKRLALAEYVKPAPPDPTFIGPRTEIERRLVELWADLLSCPAETIGLNSHFRDLGGDSLAAARLIFRVRESLNVPVTIVDFFDTSTIAQQAQVLEKLLQEPGTRRKTSTLVPIRAEGTRYPLYCLHALDGGVYFYQALLPLLKPDQPIYGLQGVGMDGTETPLEQVEDIAARQAQEIRSVQLRGPYFLCGYSAGGRLALETARYLRDQCHEPAFVFMIDDHIGVNLAEQERAQRIAQAAPIPRIRLRGQSLAYVLFRLPPRYKARYFYEKINRFTGRRERDLDRQARQREIESHEQLMPPALLKVKRSIQRAIKGYVIQPYAGPLTYLRASGEGVNIPFFRAWEKINQGSGELIDVPGTHFTLMKPPLVNIVGEHLQRWLDRLQQSTPG